MKPIMPITDEIRTSDSRKSSDMSTSLLPDTADLSLLNSTNSGSPTSVLSKRWRKPKTLNELAAQVNHAATQVLNGEIDTEKARLYAAMTRVIAQLLSVEVARSRFTKSDPLLMLDDET